MPRIRAEISPPARSSSGALIAYGTAHDVPFIWEFQGLLSTADWKKLDLIFIEHDDRRRRSAGNPTPSSDDDPKILLIDTFQEVREKTPRTRALAPATTETSIATGYVEYYAQFYAWFSKAPEVIDTVRYSSLGECSVVQMLLEECDERTNPA